MEEKIEKILLSHIEAVTEKNSPFAPTAIDGVPRSAKEIASHFRQFIEWKDKFIVYIERKRQYHLYLWFSVERKDCKEFWFDTLDELYNYWLKEVKK